MKKYTITDFKELAETSEVKISVKIEAKKLAEYMDTAIKHFGKAVKVSGFRPGKIPKEVIVKNVGEAAILEEASNIAIKDSYPAVLKEKKLLIIDAPMITVTKVAPENDLEYTLTAPVPPTFATPDYKAAAKKAFGTAVKVTVTEKEIKEAIIDLRRRRKHIELVQKNIAPEKAQTEAEKTKEADLPELDAEFLETLGGFKDMKEFTVQLKETMTKDKEAKELNKRRAQFVDEITEVEIALPTVLVSHELDRLQAQFEGDLQQVGTTLNAYLKSVDKTSEAFLEELKPQAEKQAKLQLILNAISEAEKLVPTKKDVEHELTHLLEHHKDADKDSARAYVTMQLRNQMVFAYLEGQKK
jgi:FKBP-type peptidyl-prolyl cis-trans isomerase (trigger factor)